MSSNQLKRERAGLIDRASTLVNRTGGELSAAEWDTFTELMQGADRLAEKGEQADEEFNRLTGSTERVYRFAKAMPLFKRGLIQDARAAVQLLTEELEHSVAHPSVIAGAGDSGNGDAWTDQAGQKVHVLKRGESYEQASRGGFGADYPGLTFGAFCRAMVTGARTENEKRALAEGTDSAGGFTVPDRLLAGIIDRLRAKSVAFRAGATTVPLNTDTTKIAKLATGPTAAWLAENAELTLTDATFEGITFAPKTLRCGLRASRELIEDAQNLDQALTTEFVNGMAAELDRVVLVGSGTPPEPRGIVNVVGIGSVECGADGATPTYSKIIDTVYELLKDSAPFPTAAIMNPRTMVSLAKLKDLDDQPLRKPDMIAGLPFLDTTAVGITDAVGSPPSSVASKIILGFWEDCMIGIRTQLRIEILRERYAEFLQYAFMCYLRADVQVAHPQSFAVLSKITS